MAEPSTSHPDFDRLFEIASSQQGLFTTKQAAEAGYSAQLLVHHVRAGKLARVQRGIYRVIHFPAGDHEELVAAWLWSERAGLLSHQTALALHGLTDALPAHVHITLPAAWIHRRFRLPVDLVLHHADVPANDRGWFGAIPVTNPRRTLNDCAESGLAPELLQQGARQALRRGLVASDELGSVERALAPFGGVGS